MKHCIYQILNLANGKFYIGHSQDYDIRWWEHSRKLKSNSHDNPHLQNAWNKYGEDAFEFIVIELVEEKDMLTREQFWIDNLKACNVQIGYNINPNALRPPSSKGRKHSHETRIKISKATTGISKRHHARKPKTETHKANLSFSKKDIKTWPCPDGYYCSCDICRPRRNRMKNHPTTYGNPNHELYRK